MLAVLRGFWPVGICLILLMRSSAAGADDRPFVFAYSTDIEAQGEREIEQETSWTSGHGNEAYQAVESRSEFEYGFTDNFQGAFYLNYDWSRTHAHAPLEVATTTSLPSVSGEFIYRLMNADFDPVGLAVYAEPTMGNGVRSFELKALLQKNLFNDNLRLVLNVNAEDRWEKDPSGHYDHNSALEFFSGASYSITPEWSIGAEFDNERGYEGLILAGSPRFADNAWFAGPTIQYIGGPWRLIAGAEAQLPWASDPTHTPGTISDGYLASAEHFRLRLRLGRDF